MKKIDNIHTIIKEACDSNLKTKEIEILKGKNEFKYSKVDNIGFWVMIAIGVICWTIAVIKWL